MFRYIVESSFYVYRKYRRVHIYTKTIDTVFIICRATILIGISILYICVSYKLDLAVI